MSFAIPASKNNPARRNGKKVSTGQETRPFDIAHHGKPGQPAVQTLDCQREV
jgi:hypothetical protein